MGRAEPTLRVVVALRVVSSVRRDWTAGRETWDSKAGWVVYLGGVNFNLSMPQLGWWWEGRTDCSMVNRVVPSSWRGTKTAYFWTEGLVDSRWEMERRLSATWGGVRWVG